MDRRACIWIRLAWLLVAGLALAIARDYVDQSRFAGFTTKPPVSVFFDTRYGQFYVVPLPDALQPPPMVKPPVLLSPDTKTGV